MALLFDEAQGTFKDTGSQTSPMKKQTGLMRKQMSKMEEVAPRGHTLAYITPEEAQILNKGGGGIDEQGNQMQGPYGVPMYAGFMDRFRRSSTPKPGTGASGPPGRNYPVSKPTQGTSAPPGEKGGGGYVTPLVSMPTASRAPPGEKGGGGYVAPSKFVDRQKKTREVQTDEKKKTEFVDRQKKTREAQKKETTKKVEDETPIDSGEYLKEWWKKRLQKKEQLLPVEKPKIRIAEFNLDKFNQKLGGIIGGAWGGGFTANPNILGNLGLPSGNAINDILTDKEKGVGILNWKGGVSKDIIEFLQENAPENESQKQQMINMLNRLPQNIQDNIKKAVSEGEISLDVVAVKPFMDGVTKLASGDLIMDGLAGEEGQGLMGEGFLVAEFKKTDFGDLIGSIVGGKGAYKGTLKNNQAIGDTINDKVIRSAEPELIDKENGKGWGGPGQVSDKISEFLKNNKPKGNQEKNDLYWMYQGLPNQIKENLKDKIQLNINDSTNEIQ